MIYVFGKAMLFDLPVQHVTKHVLAQLVEDAGQDNVRAIWREEYVFDPALVDPDFRELLIACGGTDPTPPDRVFKCGTIADILAEGVDFGAPTTAVLAPLPDKLPPTTSVALGEFAAVFVTAEEDVGRLGELGIEAELLPVPAFDFTGLAVPETERLPGLGDLSPSLVERVAGHLPWGLASRVLLYADEAERRVKSWRRRLGL